jgi:hypothetical protein
MTRAGSVLGGHEMRQRPPVAEEARQARVLRNRSGCRIRPQLACELLLEPFDQVTIEPVTR